MKIKRQIRRTAARLYRLCVVNGTLDTARTRDVAERVAGARTRDGLALLSHFRHLVKLDVAQHTAEVQSAVPLPEPLRKRIRAGIARMHGSGMAVRFIHNPALIGGMRIRIGSDVYDSSILAKLADLEKTF